MQKSPTMRDRKRSFDIKEIEHTEKNLDHEQLSFKKQFNAYLNALNTFCDEEDGRSTYKSKEMKPKMSVFIGVMTLMSTAVGTAVFTLPYMVYQSGIIISVLLLLFGGFLAYYTMIWLVDAAFKAKKNNYATIV